MQSRAMDDPAVRALIALLAREGGNIVVGNTIRANPKTLYQIAAGVKLPSGRPRGVGRDLREKLQRHYPGWMQSAPATEEPPPKYPGAVQTITPSSTGMAQKVSYLQSSIVPPKLSWDLLMKSQLPPEFETNAPDNAMAPEVPAGTRCIFITGAPPAPGDWVIATDQAGTPHLREYRHLRGGAWEAHATNPAYLPMHSQRDGLTVIAILDGVRRRKSAR